MSEPPVFEHPVIEETVPADGFAVRRIAVIGCGTVGTAMAALLAQARIRLGTGEPARVVLVQRRSPRSGWKIDAINEGRSPVAGEEPQLAELIRASVAAGLLSATDNFSACREADAILVCVQTDTLGDAPDFRPLVDALSAVAREVTWRSGGQPPLVIVECTLAPSALYTVVQQVFRMAGLEDGRDVYLGYSPSRIMPGRAVERLTTGDKIVAGEPEAAERIVALYRHVVTRGTLHITNRLTAEVAKTLENAYRDVRVALATEVARYCDARDVDFLSLREWLNGELLQRDLASFHPTAVPRGALLVPTLGVGGAGLPKDGHLLWWRPGELGAAAEHSLILEARRINDESPVLVAEMAGRLLDGAEGRTVALLGTAYRFNSADARRSPTLVLARELQLRGCRVRLHDPYVRADDPHVQASGYGAAFTQDLEEALDGAPLAIVCVAHRDYAEDVSALLRSARQLRVLLDAANAYDRRLFHDSGVQYGGIGRGTRPPPNELCQVVYDAFRVVERGFANETAALVQVLNTHYAPHDFARVRFEQLQQLVGTCSTGCAIADPRHAAPALDHGDFSSRLVAHAIAASRRRSGAGILAAS